MDQDVAQRLFLEGATLLFLDVPKGTEFGIDYNSWNVGTKFKGVKMIPPGFHFVFYSSVGKTGDTAPRTGLFHFFKRREIFVKKWDATVEDMVDVVLSEDELDGYRAGMQELDKNLGPYPYDSLKKWVSLTQYITEPLLERIQPLCKKLSSVTEVPQEQFRTRHESKNLCTDTDADVSQEQIQSRQGGDDMLIDTDTKSKAMCAVPDVTSDNTIRFTLIPKQMYPSGCSPAEITKYSLDSSYVLSCMLQSMSDKKEILGELQFAFICFLVGQVYDAFEHWKKLVHLLSTCDEALSKHSDLFDAFIGVLHFQLGEVPQDFFVDIISRDNFLTVTLQIFFSNLESATDVDQKLVSKARRFRENLTKRFHWDFEKEPDDFAPVVVET